MKGVARAVEPGSCPACGEPLSLFERWLRSWLKDPAERARYRRAELMDSSLAMAIAKRHSGELIDAQPDHKRAALDHDTHTTS